MNFRDNELQRMIDAQRRFDQNRARVITTEDIRAKRPDPVNGLHDAIPDTVATSAGIIQVKGPLRGIGLTGRCHPGLMAVVGPPDKIAAVASGVTTGNDWFPTKATGSSALHKHPEGCVILQPGDVVDFGESLAGAFAFLLNPYASNCYDTDDAVGIGAGPVGYGPYSDPLFRIYRGIVPSMNIPFERVPLVAWKQSAVANLAPAAAVPDAGNPDVFAFPPSARRVRVILVNTGSTKARYSGAAADAQIWWRTPGGFFVHHEADDFDAAGRGQLTTTHYVETYDVNGLVGCQVVSGATASVVYEAVE